LLGLSFVVAYLLDPSIDRLERLGLSRTLAISQLAVVALMSLGVLFLVVIPRLQLQVRQVAGRAPHRGQWLYDHLTPLLEAAAPPLSQYFGITGGRAPGGAGCWEAPAGGRSEDTAPGGRTRSVAKAV
jgi:predicted PurR-regulated permease PerM